MWEQKGQGQPDQKGFESLCSPTAFLVNPYSEEGKMHKTVLFHENKMWSTYVPSHFPGATFKKEINEMNANVSYVTQYVLSFQQVIHIKN